MDRATFKLLAGIGVLMHGGFYLVAVTVLGMQLGNHFVMCTGLAAMGVTYLSFFCHFVGQPNDWYEATAPSLVWISIGLGVLAGFGVLFG